VVRPDLDERPAERVHEELLVRIDIRHVQMVMAVNHRTVFRDEQLRERSRQRRQHEQDRETWNHHAMHRVLLEVWTSSYHNTAIPMAAATRPVTTTSAIARTVSLAVSSGGSDGSPIQRSVTCTPLSQIGPTIRRSSAPAVAASLQPEFGPGSNRCWCRP